jgi:hypothetical protein
MSLTTSSPSSETTASAIVLNAHRDGGSRAAGSGLNEPDQQADRERYRETSKQLVLVHDGFNTPNVVRQARGAHDWVHKVRSAPTSEAPAHTIKIQRALACNRQTA